MRKAPSHAKSGYIFITIQLMQCSFSEKIKTASRILKLFHPVIQKEQAFMWWLHHQIGWDCNISLDITSCARLGTLPIQSEQKFHHIQTWKKSFIQEICCDDRSVLVFLQSKKLSGGKDVRLENTVHCWGGADGCSYQQRATTGPHRVIQYPRFCVYTHRKWNQDVKR